MCDHFLALRFLTALIGLSVPPHIQKYPSPSHLTANVWPAPAARNHPE